MPKNYVARDLGGNLKLRNKSVEPELPVKFLSVLLKAQLLIYGQLGAGQTDKVNRSLVFPNGNSFSLLYPG